MEKDIETKISFAEWAVLKQDIHFNRQAPYFKEREIWWTSIGYNIGNEQNGRNDMFERPVLVLKRFNSFVFLGLPLTGKAKEGKHYYPINIDGRETSVIISQIRLFDSKRLIRKMTVLDEDNFIKIKNKFCENLKSG